ncbi:MAG: DUF6655 family protein [Planctomycetota bacterium]
MPVPHHICLIGLIVALLLVMIAGCGTTKLQQATDQLVLSEAVDRSVQAIDFRPLSGQRVYLDPTYIRTVRGLGFVNADYVISSIRQQIMAAGCLLQDKSADADIIIEPRIGTLGADDYSVTYGIPQNDSLARASALIPSAPPVPAIPEISIARRESREGAAKIAAFAYLRETRQPVWQSGINQSESTAASTWVMGIGPFQTGSIRSGTQLAGTRLRFGSGEQGSSPRPDFVRPKVNYMAEVRYDHGWPITGRHTEDYSFPELMGPPQEDQLATQATAFTAGQPDPAKPVVAPATHAEKN